MGKRRSDQSLIRACLGGDERAWETLILRYRRLIYSVPVAYRLPADGPDEVFQRVAVKLFEHLGRLRKIEGLASWLVITARRECQAQLRAASRFTPVDGDEDSEPGEDPPDVVGDLHLVECEHALALSFEQLGEPCRALLYALYIEEPSPSYKEVSERMDRPVGSLGPTRARCLAKLRKLYLAQGGKEPSWS